MNLKDVKALAAAGKIRGYAIQGSQKATKKKKAGNPSTHHSPHRNGLEAALMEFCKSRGLPLFVEQRFHPVRKWRFDFLIPGKHPVAIEYEGLTVEKSGHTTSTAFSGNTEKYNAAAAVGIIVIRYTYQNWKNCYNDLKSFFL